MTQEATSGLHFLLIYVNDDLLIPAVNFENAKSHLKYADDMSLVTSSICWFYPASKTGTPIMDSH